MPLVGHLTDTVTCGPLAILGDGWDHWYGGVENIEAPGTANVPESNR